MKKIRFALLFALAFLVSCEFTKSVTITSSWLNREKFTGKAYKKIYIMGLFNNTSVGSVLEYVLSDESKTRGYTPYMHHSEFPINLMTLFKQKA